MAIIVLTAPSSLVNHHWLDYLECYLSFTYHNNIFIFFQQPNTLMVQEFEQILIDNADNEPEKFTAAIHKLLESSSSSPGHSPFGKSIVDGTLH